MNRLGMTEMRKMSNEDLFGWVILEIKQIFISNYNNTHMTQKTESGKWKRKCFLAILFDGMKI